MKGKITISKAMSYYLRHCKDLKISEDGFVILHNLLEKLREKWSSLSREDIEKIVRDDQKGRFEIFNDKIRSRYGHSIDVCFNLPVAEVDILYHGTSKEFSKIILNEGLKPMRRKKVHLSKTIEDAMEVAKRRKDPVVLKIDAQRAIKEGIKIQEATDKVYLVDYIPGIFISILNPGVN
jgi:putative RNA 2'-phosphotransferase